MQTGLCLSGGGVKGAAHIGAIKAFEEEKIEFDYISGTSSGSIVATLYAAGYNADEMYRIFKEYCKNIKYIDGKNICKMIKSLLFKGKLFIDGLNSGEELEKIINSVCSKKNIQNIKDFKKRLLIPSVDVYTGNTYIFTSEENRKNRNNITDSISYVSDINIGKAVRASCSYPGVFSPCVWNDLKLVDGGIRENVPWKELKNIGVDEVICIVFEKELKQKKCCDNIIDIITNSIDILGNELANYEINGADCIIDIKSKNVSLLDFSKIDILYKLGYQETKKHINIIKKEIIQKRNRNKINLI